MELLRCEGLPKELTQMAQEDHSLLQSVYREIADRLGVQTAVEMYSLFHGQQISFPMRLYDPEDIRSRVIREYDGTNLRQLATRYGYSEKTIRRMIRSEK